MSAVRVIAMVFVLLLGACSSGATPTSEEAYVRETRTQLTDVFGDEVPEYSDEELLTYGRRACDNLTELADANALRRSIEEASVGASDNETLQVAQATVIVTTAGRHLCPEQGERLGLFDEGASA